MMRYMMALLAVFAVLIVLEASALGQTLRSPASQIQKEQPEPARANESSTEDKVVAGLEKKLPRQSISPSASF